MRRHVGKQDLLSQRTQDPNPARDRLSCTYFARKTTGSKLIRGQLIRAGCAAKPQWGGEVRRNKRP